jgi:hypothetical protein
MKQYISIVLRNQFNLFYRFGYSYIPSTFLIEFDGSISDEVKRKIIELFNRITPFEYDEEYLILHLEKETNEDNYPFNIQDIVAIYPLSPQAKDSIESKIDPRIRLESPIEDILSEVELKIEKEEIEKAISALWAICKIEDSSNKYIESIGLENIYKGLAHRKNGIKADKIKTGNYWEYLITYDRHGYFPNTTLGYFYDAGQIFAYSKGQATFEGSKLHEMLMNLKDKEPDIKLKDIIKSLEKEEKAQGYISQTSPGEIKQYEITPIYLILCNEIRNVDDIIQTSIIKNLDGWKKFGDSFNYAVILLGSFFGFRKFYDAYYDLLNLRFYKNYKPIVPSPPQEQQEEEMPPIKTEQPSDKKNGSSEAESIYERLLKECPGVKKRKDIYLDLIRQYLDLIQQIEMCNWIEKLEGNSQIGKSGAPKNVINFFKKEIKKINSPKSRTKSNKGGDLFSEQNDSVAQIEGNAK